MFGGFGAEFNGYDAIFNGFGDTHDLEGRDLTTVLAPYSNVVAANDPIRSTVAGRDLAGHSDIKAVNPESLASTIAGGRYQSDITTLDPDASQATLTPA